MFCKVYLDICKVYFVFAVSNFINLIFMYYNKFLLPHFVQHIGAALLVLAAVCLCFCKCEMVLFLSLTAASVGLLLTVISRESTEDEYSGYLRMRSVFCVVLGSKRKVAE